ncbi:MAG: SDR family oxidoreductase [Eubacteriales bacterium]|nr:SDR family oxidoreductase [Eubacteriales bacterium]
MNFKEKVFIVTGASSGMGKSCSELLLENDAVVVGIDRNDSTIEHDRYSHCKADVLDEEQIQKCISEVDSQYGHIDGLVNAAGIFGNNKPFYELTMEEWNKVISVNTTGTFIVSKAASPVMIREKHGKIVNISCIRSTIFKNNMADYAASKGAVASMTSAMALDLAPYNIQVNSVAPGFIYTGMTAASFDIPDVRAKSEALIPNGRLGMPKDIASVVLFLLSDMSDYVTGTMLFADGGYHIQK